MKINKQIGDKPDNNGDKPSNGKEGRMPRLVGQTPLIKAKEGLMPQLIKKRRSVWSLLVVSSLLASFLAIGPSMAAEVIATGSNNKAKQSYTPSTSACVGEEATKDYEFTDVGEGSDFRSAINCLAYYGITRGTGDGTTFSPYDSVTRTQIVKFITRASQAAGANVSNVLGDFSKKAEEGYANTLKDVADL